MTNTDYDFAELDIQALQQNFATGTEINCATLAANIEAEAGQETTREYLTYNKLYLGAGTNVAHIGGTIMHEIGHNKYFGHWPNPGSREYSNTGNEIFRWCSLGADSANWPRNAANSQIFLGSAMDPSSIQAHPEVSPGRSQLSRETLLAVVGLPGGAAFDEGCSMDAMVNGVDVSFDGVHITSFATSCQSPFGSTGWWNTVYPKLGTGGGTAVSLRCNANEVLVGLSGGVNEYLNRIGIYCADRDTWRNLPPQSFYGHKLGEPNVHFRGDIGVATPQYPWVRGCPTGMSVKGIRGRSGNRIDQLEFTCQAINRDMDIKRAWLASLTGSLTSAGENLEFCAGHGVLTGLSIQTTTSRVNNPDPAQEVSRAGGFCDTVTWNANEELVLVAGEQQHMAAHGGGGGEYQDPVYNNDLSCGPGQALVAMDVRVGRAIAAIEGQCAPTAAWSNLAAPKPAFTSLGSIGGTAGNVTHLECGRGAYLNGWYIGEFGSALGPITRLQPICRTFTLAAPGYATTIYASAVSGGAINLLWWAEPEASHYVIRRSTSTAGPYTDIKADVTDTYYTDATVSPSTTYYYKVAVANSAGVGPESAYIQVAIGIPPAAPTGLTATLVTSSRVDLTWAAGSGNEEGFQIQRLVGSSWNWVVTLAGSARSYSDTVSGSPPYQYRVSAFNSAGSSGNSNTASTARPTATITSPANNANFTPGTQIIIYVTATEDYGAIGKVEFYRSGSSAAICTATAYPYTCTWTGVPAGSYALTAKAYDTLGASITSAPVNITVAYRPTVSITSPANNATYAELATVTINATASETGGTITKVDFYRTGNGTPICSDTTSPYSCTWSNAAAGSYTLTATAYDSAGFSTTSAGVNITVTGAKKPTVSITSPANNATFTAPATVTINATASETGGTITKVEFYRSGSTTALCTDTASPYTCTWSNAGAGSYTMTAKAYDSTGTSTTSAGVNITLTAANVPTVSITSPANNATFTAPANVTINATASETGGTITKVEFYRTGSTTAICTDTTSPYSCTWSSAAAGSYTLTAKAYDSAGVATTSAGVNITVSASSNDPCASLCSPVVVKAGPSIQSGNLGTGAICHSTTSALSGGNCSNMTGRTLTVNGTTISCSAWALPAKRNTGYCIQVTSGGLDYASYATW